MASIGHIAVGMAAGRFCGRPQGRPTTMTLMLALSGLSLLPDADVVAFVLRIPYEAPWGHRGATHSIAMAIAVGVCVAAVWPALGKEHRRRWAVVTTLVVMSHGLLDTLTDGGLGAALAWPLSDARFFAPWRPLAVAPIGMGLLTARGMRVMLVETLIFAPLFAYALWPRGRPPATTPR